MKFENKYVVAYNEEKVIVAKSEGTGEIFVPTDITVKIFDSNEERLSYIESEGLTEELQ